MKRATVTTVEGTRPGKRDLGDLLTHESICQCVSQSVTLGGVSRALHFGSQALVSPIAAAMAQQILIGLARGVFLTLGPNQEDHNTAMVDALTSVLGSDVLGESLSDENFGDCSTFCREMDDEEGEPSWKKHPVLKTTISDESWKTLCEALTRACVRIGRVGGHWSPVLSDRVLFEALDDEGDHPNFLQRLGREELEAALKRCLVLPSTVGWQLRPKDQGPWHEDEGRRRNVVQRWLRGERGDRVWSRIHALPVAFLGKALFCPDDNLVACPTFLVRLTDGEGSVHELCVAYNQGDADANTGLFGVVYSAEHLWAILDGRDAGDCGTRIKVSSEALQEYAPHPDGFPSDLFPDFIWKPECDSFTDGSQVSLVLFALVFLLYRQPKRSFASLSSRFQKPVMKAFLGVLQSRLLSQGSIDNTLPSYVLDNIVSFLPPYELPVFNEGVFQAYQKAEADGKVPDDHCLDAAAEEHLKHNKDRETRDSWPYGGLMKPHAEQLAMVESAKGHCEMLSEDIPAFGRVYFSVVPPSHGPDGTDVS